MDFLIAKTDSYIPKNYFCKFELILLDDVDWEINIYRYISVINTEKIEVVIHSGIKTYYDDDYLRARSFIYADNGLNYTSHMNLELKNAAKSVLIYARNNLAVTGSTFKI